MGRAAAKTQARQRLNSFSGGSSATSAERRAGNGTLRQRKQVFKKFEAKRQATAAKVVKVPPVSHFDANSPRACLETMHQHPWAFIECELFLKSLRAHSDRRQRRSASGDRNAPRSAGIYTLVVELLSMYAQQKLTREQLVAGLRGALKHDHKEVAGALTALLESIHSQINTAATSSKSSADGSVSSQHDTQMCTCVSV